MKKLFFIVSVILLIVGINACKSNKTIENSAIAQINSSQLPSDWVGVYSGIIPCADCSGIETQITLNSDNTFKITSKYLDEEEVVSIHTGEIQWSKDGKSIALSELDKEAFPSQYKVEKNALIQLDLEGNIITGELASNYILTKVDINLIEKHWKLIEIFGTKLVDKPEPAKEPYITFKIEGNRVVGNGGCNNFTGTYKLGPGNRIRFSSIASTRMMCINDMEIEEKMNQILEMTDNYYVNEDTLILNRARMAPLARFEAVYMK